MMTVQQASKAMSYYASLSDDQLLDAELVTDDPENLPNLVREIPIGNEEPWVEYKYDLRGQGREQEFRCAHCHIGHLAGFVLRKGDARYMVGWICANALYGHVFEAIRADFEQVQNRKVVLHKRRETESEVRPFLAWLERLEASDVFKQYESVRRQISGRMEFIWTNSVNLTANGYRAGLRIPHSMFTLSADAKSSFSKLVAEVRAFTGNLHTAALEELSLKQVNKSICNFMARAEKAILQIQEIEDFFQPACLEAFCLFANRNDNPKKRSYSFGLLSITCKRVGGDKTTVEMPAGFRVPDRGAIAAMRDRLSRLA